MDCFKEHINLLDQLELIEAERERDVDPEDNGDEGPSKRSKTLRDPQNEEPETLLEQFRQAERRLQVISGISTGTKQGSLKAFDLLKVQETELSTH